MANALKFHAVVRGKTLPLPDLAAFEGKRVEVIVVEDETPEAQQPANEERAPRPLGEFRGQFTVPDDFKDPPPREIQKYFDGEGDE
jgi:hypothetical protein